MNIRPNIKTGISVCPHDCPSACALEVELLDERTIGRVRGAKDNSYTLGVICEKVGRYAERIHHPDRLLYPLKRSGPKGSGEFKRITWDEAMASNFQFCPNVDALTVNSPAPVQADAQGRYPAEASVRRRRRPRSEQPTCWRPVRLA